MAYCLIKYCALPLRIYNCIGILSVLILDDVPWAGFSIKSEAAVNINLIQGDQQVVQPGEVTESDIMNTLSRDTAMCKSCGKIHVKN
jgi:hypothetical protein